VLAAVKSCGLALQYAPDTLRDDREVVLAAVTKDGMALQHAGPNMQADREVAFAAITQNENAVPFVKAPIDNIPIVLYIEWMKLFWWPAKQMKNTFSS